MPAPSRISIATSALNRLVKEEKSYRNEHESQEERIAKLEASQGDDDENAEYILRQERKALEETEAMFPQLKLKIAEAKEKLEAQLEQDKGPGDQSNTPEDVTKAKEAIAAALVAIRESS